MATVMCMSSDEAHTPLGPVPATFIGTFIPGGDSIRVCDECMPNFCAAVFERMTGVDMTPALYLASVEGQENPDGAVGHPEEVAAPVQEFPTTDIAGSTADDADTPGDATPADVPGRSGGSPPPAPADEDQEAGADDRGLSPEAKWGDSDVDEDPLTGDMVKVEPPPSDASEPSAVSE
jgi:hypothetical protein